MIGRVTLGLSRRSRGILLRELGVFAFRRSVLRTKHPYSLHWILEIVRGWIIKTREVAFKGCGIGGESGFVYFTPFLDYSVHVAIGDHRSPYAMYGAVGRWHSVGTRERSGARQSLSLTAGGHSVIDW